MYYNIKDFAKISGLSASNIRYYEKKGYPEAQRSDSGYRQYTVEDVYRLNTFNSLLSQGFSVAESIDRLNPHTHTAKDYLHRKR